ncbi:sulfur carrier protein ThiS [Pontibacter akesuensis]|uniref:Sulfur carrier protein ThiS n=2 Tax=Pontibacter akesuensis TaxID=388950 RepID=A0A1I7JBA1_9BACT|nr:thiamine biosynthesis protein ThiS [Pontibacter akesuensis]SFU82442.1 sulfur carrier protein ThiS [Pontibacter akesuensis]
MLAASYPEQTMTIFLNNQAKELSEPSSVSALLQLLQLEQQRGIAVAVNDQVLPRSNWASYLLQPNDRLTLIRATQGG